MSRDEARATAHATATIDEAHAAAELHGVERDVAARSVGRVVLHHHLRHPALFEIEAAELHPRTAVALLIDAKARLAARVLHDVVRIGHARGERGVADRDVVIAAGRNRRRVRRAGGHGGRRREQTVAPE